MTRKKKSREKRNRAKAKLRAAAKRVGDLEGRIVNRLEQVDRCIGCNPDKTTALAVKSLLDSASNYLHHLKAFPERRDALIGLLIATGLTQPDDNLGGTRALRFVCDVYMSDSYKLRITRMGGDTVSRFRRPSASMNQSNVWRNP